MISSNASITCEVADEAGMLALGAALAACLRPGLVIYLHGPLGAGKTTLVRGMLHALGHDGIVRSPTYAIVEDYELPTWRVCHCDLYRLGDREELEYLGLRDLLAEDAVLCVEWPERGRGGLPEADLVVTMAYDERGRCITLDGVSDEGRAVLDCMGPGSG